MQSENLYNYLLLLGDNSMILGHRLSELCGHGPSLETDIALTNISLDLFGQVRSYFQYAAKLKGAGATEDSIAMLRAERAYKNTIIVEQPNTDFAHVIARQFLFDAFHFPLLQQLKESKDEIISAIAHKSIKEVSYHLRFSSEWMKRLGDGTPESGVRMKVAMEHFYPLVHEMFIETDTERTMKLAGIGADLSKVKVAFNAVVEEIFMEAKLEIPEIPEQKANGKTGIHSEQFGFILTELQYMQRAYPNMEW